MIVISVLQFFGNYSALIPFRFANFLILILSLFSIRNWRNILKNYYLFILGLFLLFLGAIIFVNLTPFLVFPLLLFFLVARLFFYFQFRGYLGIQNLSKRRNWIRLLPFALTYLFCFQFIVPYVRADIIVFVITMLTIDNIFFFSAFSYVGTSKIAFVTAVAFLLLTDITAAYNFIFGNLWDKKLLTINLNQASQLIFLNVIFAIEKSKNQDTLVQK